MRAVIWGTGGTAVEVLRQKLLYSKYEIAAFTDSDPESWGKVFWRGIPVVPPEEMKEISYDIVIVCSLYYEEIIDTMINDLQINRDRIITYKALEQEACKLVISKYENSTDTEIQEALDRFRQGKLSILGSYAPEVKEYHAVRRDEENFPYIMFGDKRMYYPKDHKFVKKNGVEAVEDVLYEQGGDSPHLYIRDEKEIPDDAVIVDAGVCEGNFALRFVDRAKKIYLIESDVKWMEALRRTFREYQEKVVFCNKFLSGRDNARETTLDSLVSEKIDFLKMDIEGAEVEALLGGKEVLLRSSARCAVCSYHRQYDEKYISHILESYGYKTSHSKGYMFFSYDDDINDTLDFRRGVVYGVKE